MNIQETIAKLKSIDINELGSLVQNINWLGVKDRLQSKPHILINIALVIITIIATVSTYSSYKGQSTQLKQQFPLLEEKLSVIKEKDSLQSKYDNIINNLPQSLSGDQLVDKLSELAIHNKVQIISLPETKTSTHNFYESVAAEIDVSAEHYQDVVNFVKDIEESPYFLRVTKWSGSLGQAPRSFSRMPGGEAQKSKEPSIYVTLGVDSIVLKK